MSNNKGTVIQVMGPVLDIRFADGQLPELLSAIEIPHGETTIIAEVAQHIGDNVVRCIAMSSTDGLARGVEATDTGAPITVPQVTRTGYTGAWDAEPVLTMPDGPLTYTMVWTANKHTVTFISHGDVVAKKIAVYYGQTIKTPTVTRDGYRFTGWDASIPETMPDEDLVFTAQWSLITYTITYDLDRGTNSSLNPATYTVESPTITLAQPTRKGHTFLGWYEQVGNSLKKVTSIAAGSTGNIFWRGGIYSDTEEHTAGTMSVSYYDAQTNQLLATASIAITLPQGQSN